MHRLGLGVLPLGIEVRGQVVVAVAVSGWSSPRALSVIARALRCIASASAYFPWREVHGQVVVAGGGVGVVLAQDLEGDRQGLRCTASASAYFPWALRLAARLL